MNGLNKFMDGLYKIIAPWVDVVFALIITIAGNMGMQALKVWALMVDLAGGDVPSSIVGGVGKPGLITFFQVIYWLVALVFIASKVLKALHTLTSNPQAMAALKSVGAAAPAQNNAYAQPVQQSVPTPAANAGADRFCTQCGAKVPAGNGFCTSCGAKMD